MLCIYIWCCVHVFYAMICIDGVVNMFFMQCCVQVVLCACWICDVVYIVCCAHVIYAVLCACGVVCMLDMRCYVHMVLCVCWICSVVYIW